MDLSAADTSFLAQIPVLIVLAIRAGEISGISATWEVARLAAQRASGCPINEDYRTGGARRRKVHHSA